MRGSDYLKLKHQLLQVFFFILVVVCAIVIIFMSTYTDKTRNNSVSLDVFHEELVSKARKEANCTKPDGANGYVVCERLPYSEVRCGEFAKPREVADKQGRKYVVPDVIHFIWFGPFSLTNFYQYLALRSAASIQSPRKILIHHDGVVIQNEIWKRVKKEIPCIRMVKREKPKRIFRFEIPEPTFAADVARLQILKEHGGVYLDLDVITLKPLEPMRIYPASIGRSSFFRASAGIILSERKSEFISTWILWYQTMKYRSGNRWTYFGQDVPYSLASQEHASRIIHLEEVSFNRPNPYVDGMTKSIFDHIETADNFFLHLHPSKVKQNPDRYRTLEHWKGDQLRTLDNVYGQAARKALFGSEDIVFLPGEKCHEPKPKRRIIPFAENGAGPLP